MKTLIPSRKNKDTKVHHETCQILAIVSKLIFLNMNEKGSPKDGIVRWCEFVSLFLRKGIIVLLFCASPLLADISPNRPPQSNDTTGGSLSPVYSEANSTAISWLTLLDQGQYSATWSQGGSLLKDIVPQNQWVAAMQAIRKPLGNATTRKVSGSQATETLPGGTKGSFMIINYQTSFSNKPFVTEKITMMAWTHERWQVISYDLQTK
ncbi:MAG: hypothetical protein K1000chlam4_00855 [Chlamydiae bacterium]|nr:hypothetical protein [Chlamydiota bacterium]